MVIPTRRARVTVARGVKNFMLDEWLAWGMDDSVGLALRFNPCSLQSLCTTGGNEEALVSEMSYRDYYRITNR
jgi:hypothetical protein